MAVCLQQGYVLRSDRIRKYDSGKQGQCGEERFKRLVLRCPCQFMGIAQAIETRCQDPRPTFSLGYHDPSTSGLSSNKCFVKHWDLD